MRTVFVRSDSLKWRMLVTGQTAPIADVPTVCSGLTRDLALTLIERTLQ